MREFDERLADPVGDEVAHFGPVRLNQALPHGLELDAHQDEIPFTRGLPYLDDRAVERRQGAGRAIGRRRRAGGAEREEPRWTMFSNSRTLPG